jgi:three-Cys-motif partner protein
MPIASGVLWEADLHTLAKHRLLRAYLAAWLPTLLQGGYPGVTYAEGFAGPGIYTGDEPGSPIVALQAFLGHRNLLAAGRTVDMVLAEKSGRRLAELRRQMNWPLAAARAPAATFRIEYVHGDHAVVLLPALERSARWTGRCSRSSTATAGRTSRWTWLAGSPPPRPARSW